MTLTEAQAKIRSLRVPVFQTSDVSACLNVSKTHASKILERLKKASLLHRVTRGIWRWPEMKDPLLLPEYLTAPAPAYISLYSALFYHGLISQIPEVTYAVSLARTRSYKTDLGTISIHHLHEQFFFGFETIGQYGFKMATPEKALLDTLYFSKARSGWFRSLPEIDLPQSFRLKTVFAMLKQVPQTLRITMQEKLEKLL